MAAYHAAESSYAQPELHRLNMTGFDDDLDSNSGQQTMRPWRGFEAFERQLVGCFGLDDRRHLVEYGEATSTIWDVVLRAAHGCRVLVTDMLYRPWAIRLAREAEAGRIKVERVRLRGPDPIDRSAHSDVAARVVHAARAAAADIVVLSAVSQTGYRLPIREIATALRVSDDRRTTRPPLLVLDVCQAFCRVALALHEAPLGDPGCAVIGCTHKAARGPKTMGFLICTNCGWHTNLRQARDRGEEESGMRLYARTNGEHPLLATTGCAPAVGAACALEGLNIEATQEIERRVLLNEMSLRVELTGTEWRAADVPMPACSGILLIQPPRMPVDRGPATVVRELLQTGSPRIYVDQIGDHIRVAFDRSHADGMGTQLAEALRTIDSGPLG
ncbi:MAG: hypothetical protein GY733_05420 [bacterium]|nr:hypothetical protein [bacterium]